MTTRYDAGSDVKFRTGEIGGMKIIYGFLIVVDEVEGFLNWIVFFLIDIVFEKSWGIASIEFGVQDAVDILSSFIIFGDYELARCLDLIRQRIGSYMI